MRDYKGKEIQNTTKEEIDFLKFQIKSLEKRKARCEKNNRVENIKIHGARLKEMTEQLEKLEKI